MARFSLLLIALLLTCQFASAKTAASPPETVRLTTPDGVHLRATYYKAPGGRDSPVVVLLSDAGESRAVFRSLAKHLQDPPQESDREGCAVLAVDLRLQGDSNRQQTADGSTRNLSAQKITPAVLNAMVKTDMETVRKFLVNKNDAGELNLNRLTYLGVGMGAVVATNAAALDWSVRQLNTGKQGQDVKALVLVSPPWKYKGLGMLNALRQPGVQSKVAVLLMYGKEDRNSVKDAERIVKQLERGRRNEPAPEEGQLPTLLDAAAKSSLKGTVWLKQAGSTAEELAAQFLEQHVAEPAYPWTQRRLD